MSFSDMGYDAIGYLLIEDEDLNPDGFGDMSVVATYDGCRVEPDGTCEHGYESPLLRLGLI
tara:strand:- start:175 stop:357 length:183 start_codon:yes stop_codon:yes gene_type:complete